MKLAIGICLIGVVALSGCQEPRGLLTNVPYCVVPDGEPAAHGEGFTYLYYKGPKGHGFASLWGSHKDGRSLLGTRGAIQGKQISVAIIQCPTEFDYGQVQQVDELMEKGAELCRGQKVLHQGKLDLKPSEKAKKAGHDGVFELPVVADLSCERGQLSYFTP
jgi:hypothetical protein